MKLKIKDIQPWLQESGFYKGLEKDNIEDEIDVLYYKENINVEDINSFILLFNTCEFWNINFPDSLYEFATIKDNYYNVIQILSSKMHLKHVREYIDNISYKKLKSNTYNIVYSDKVKELRALLLPIFCNDEHSMDKFFKRYSEFIYKPHLNTVDHLEIWQGLGSNGKSLLLGLFNSAYNDEIKDLYSQNTRNLKLLTHDDNYFSSYFNNLKRINIPILFVRNNINEEDFEDFMSSMKTINITIFKATFKYAGNYIRQEWNEYKADAFLDIKLLEYVDAFRDLLRSYL